jgi:hypothetical protein
MRLPTVSVAVVHAGRTDPRGIVSAAIEERKGRKQEKSWSKGDAVWAVFDGDEHKDNNPGNWNDALQLADSNDINLAISNPSFELWYLLHFQDQLAKMNRQEVLVALTRHLPDYKKANRLWPTPLQPLTMAAIIRAARLAQRIDQDGLEKHANPCCGVGALVEFLLELEQAFKK